MNIENFYHNYFKKLITGTLIAGASLIGLTSTTVKATDFPKRDITIVVPHGPGGGIDTYARAIVPYLERHLPNDINIRIDNRTGASGVIGARYFVNVPADGYTLFFGEPGGLFIQQKLADTGYDVTKFNWLGQLRYEPAVTFVTADSDIKSLDDLLNFDGRLTVSVPSLRTTAGISAVLTFSGLGIDYSILAGSGTGDAVTATLRGDAMVHHNNTGGVTSYVEDGDLIPILINGSESYDSFPDASTMIDAGHPELSSVGVFMAALAAPPGTSDDVLEILNEAMVAAMSDEDFLGWSETNNRPIVTANGERTAANIRAIADSLTPFMDTLAEIFAN